MIKPKKLSVGDKVAAVTLSFGGPGAFPGRYERCKRQIQDELGIEIVETPNALRDPNWIYENPKARAEDLMEAFADPSIRAIFSTIGGDDSVRMIPYLDLEVIRKNPKIFMGYSDTTVTHFACFKAGLTSFYGPSILAEFGEVDGTLPYTLDSVRRTLFSSLVVGELKPSNAWTVEHLNWADPTSESTKRFLQSASSPKILQGNGKASGRLIGGCFEVLEMIKGTEYWPDPETWKGAILFLETSEDAPSPTYCEYWLRNYGSRGILQNLGGILFGRPGGHKVPVEDFAKYDAALTKIAREFGRADLPILSRLDFGHTDPKFVLPLGVRATIDCDRGTVSLDEPSLID